MAEVENKKPAFRGLKMPEFKIGKSGLYVLEHFLLLVHVLVALVLVSSMFNKLLEHWTDTDSSMFPLSGGYDEIVGLLAATVVVVPLMMFFFQRVTAAEKTDAKLLKKTWRSIWLNTFLAGIFFWGLSAVVTLVTELVDGLLNVGLEAGGEALWVSVVRQLFVILLLCYVGQFFYSSSKTKKADESRRFLVAFSALAVLLLVMTAIWPLTDQRNSRVDDLIELDLSSISQLVDDYVLGESELPSELSDLSLEEEVENRADKYNYEFKRLSASSFAAEYELCAVFKTDTNNEESVVTPFELDLFDIASGTSPSYPDFDQNEFSMHAEGRDCFELQSTVYNPFFRDSAQPTDDFDLNSLFESAQ